ncbi:SpoIIE family protein phosphatase [Nocardioides panacis]|uniref:Protein-serine/threonine phosphatase n=2 Tax=Nocardioides panacis TaxID=2849501 RepID=A0A975SZC6_9ACTN|nr:SpoIIE family protein phosphatase [Nocardioides panacis]
MQGMFQRSGEVGSDLLKVDWAATPLGPLDTWPRSLESVVRLMLTSRFSMWMAWGPELTFLCNEAYRRDTLGDKYPWALGRPAAEVWSEIWDDISDRIAKVMSTGVATWDESLMLFLERSGYTEESFHTFSYSPIFDDFGVVAGMLCVVKEDTEEVVAHRRMQTLRDLGSRRASNLTETETISAACEELESCPSDLPFSLVYLFDGDETARLVGSVGFTGEHPGAPDTIAVGAPDEVWPAAAAARGASTVVRELEDRFFDLPTGSWQVSPREALVLPLAASAGGRPYGFQVFGLNRFRPLDDGYRDFCDLVAGQLAASLTDARAYEFERDRAETLAELDQAKTDFFTNVSHEFRTPLTLLLGPAEDAVTDEDDPLTGRQRDRVEVILRNGQRLLKLVNTLLDFSRLESGRVEARFEPVDLGQYTRELASMFDTAAQRLALELTVDSPSLSEPVYVDRDLWAKVVLNLLSNALKFTFEGGITVRLAVGDDGDAELTVSDTGTGIPEHEVGHLFERFHRVSGARSRTHEGSGIGLALVAELVALHGGRVSAESEVGRGTTFTVRLPLGDTHLPADQVAAPRGSTSAAVTAVAEGFIAEATHWTDPDAADLSRAPGDTGQDRPRILVVDDNADIREYVAGLLADDYAVQTAVDGVDGLEQARRLPPDLVLTDVMMPRMDGFALLAALQGDATTVGVPVVMLSARAGEEGTLEGLDAGADDYLVKPFTARELLARVRSNLELDRARRTRRQLERSRSLLAEAQRLARVGSWEIDLATGQAEFSDEYLRVMGRTREELAGWAWGELIDRVVHPEDKHRVAEDLSNEESGFHYEFRVIRGDGSEILVAIFGEAVLDDDGKRVGLRGSVQDITERRAAEEALAMAAANAEAAAREHAIADQLQRSLLPQKGFDLDHLEVATYYRAGVEGTQVGGDWYDVIELGGGRTALVVGDVMGRGVRAAAVMGQLRSAVRAYARLDLPPADLLESLDGLVRDLGEDQIVTCIYAVFDPADRCLRFANAGHLPPIVAVPGGECRLVGGDENPPLGVGPFNLTQHHVELEPNARVVLYTDGLVERRGEDIDVGIETLASRVAQMVGPVDGVPEELVAAMLPDGPDDDVAILVARVDPPTGEESLSRRLEPSETAVAVARHLVTSYLEERAMPAPLVADAALATSELVTNAVLHGRAPVELRLRLEGSDVLVEVRDRATYQPRKQRPDENDEHGRGLQIVSALAARWGTRPTEHGKAVWCILSAKG